MLPKHDVTAPYVKTGTTEKVIEAPTAKVTPAR